MLIFTHLGSSRVTRNENIKQIHLFSFSFTDGESYSAGQHSGQVLPSRRVCSIFHPRLVWQGGKCINFRDLLASNFCDLQGESQARKDGECNFEKQIIFSVKQKMHIAFKNNKPQLFKMQFFSCVYATRTSENDYFCCCFFFNSL